MRKRLLFILLAILLVLSALSACRNEESSVTPTEETESVTDKHDPTTAAPTKPSPTETDPPETIPPETDPPETTPPETEPPETVPFETEAIDPDILSFTPENYPKVDGSTSTKPLAKSIQEEFTGEKDVEIKHSKSHQSYLNLIDGLCDMILAVEPSPDEYAYAAEKGVTMHIEKVTNEGFVFFVNKRNPIESLTIQQIQDIYSGKITNWKDVGGLDAEIVAFQRPTNSGSQTGMESLVMKDIPMMEPVKGTVADTMNEIVDVISAFDSGENAIGYSYYYYANTMYLGENVKLIAVEGVKPNNTTIREGDYPFLTAYYAITRQGDMSEETADLLQGILSERGQRAVQRAGYVPVIDVGDYDPEHPEISNERTVSLSDTYSMNPVRVLTKKDTYEGQEYQYAVLSGLSDTALLGKINETLHEEALSSAKKGLERGGEGAAINASYVQTEANFSNVLSVVFRNDIVTKNSLFFEYTSVNLRLDTGEKLRLQDLFKSDTRGKDIFNADFYGEVVFKTAGTKHIGESYEPSVTNYNDAEDRILSLILDYDAGKDFSFYFTPREVILLGQLKSGDTNLNLWFTHCMEEVTIYHRFADAKVSYDGKYPSIEGIPVLTDRDDPYLSTVEKNDDYYLDAALYVIEDWNPADIPEFLRDRVLPLYEDYLNEILEDLQSKAAEGIYCFYNLTAFAQVPVWETAGTHPYVLNASYYYLSWNTKEDLQAAYLRTLKAIRNPHWDDTGGRNHYIFGAVEDLAHTIGHTKGRVWYFDKNGNVVDVQDSGY